ncbi:MAG: sensor domain-containing diguanylate cyclase [Actinomycetota bacterium]|nr:sensor domain-containing diguanylate cyclase [Actinomycetota bacterium]
MHRGNAVSATRAEEVASLAERMGYMQALRAVFAVVVLGAAVFSNEVRGAAPTDLILLTAAYLILSATVEGLRRGLGRRGIAILEWMLLVDAVYLALVGYATGATQSPLRFLAYLHLIAVTLLASYRTGIKIAIWHSMLFFVAFYAQISGILPPIESSEASRNIEEPSILNVVALLLVAIGTMAFSSLNERELRRRRSDLEELTETARKLEDVSVAGDAAGVLLTGVSDAVGVARGVVLAAPTGSSLELLAYRGPNESTDIHADSRDAVIDQAWRDRDTQLVKKLDPDANPRLASLLPFAQNLAVVPLFAEGDPIGVLAVEYGGRSGSRVERRVLKLVNQFASHAALALRNAWLLEEVRTMADTDALTGIANRRTFETVLERELSRAKRHGEQLTLVLLDIDHFKKLNDVHGHQTGDEVLRQTGHTLAAGCRDFDTAARYGGEEFAVIMPSCSPVESLPAADRLRTSLSRMDVPVAITASAGVATFPTHASDLESLIKAADEALYESKRTGRDRVTRSRRTASVMQTPLRTE